MAYEVRGSESALAIDQADARVVQIERQLETAISAWASSGATARDVIDIYADLANADALFDATAQVPGIVAAARAKRDDPAYDFVGNANTMRSAISSALDAIEAVIPTAPNGRVAVMQLDRAQASGVTFDSYTAGQTASVRTALQAVVDSIDRKDS